MRNAGLEETQAGIKIARRNINHLRYANDTTLIAESEEEPKSLFIKVIVESEKVGLLGRARTDHTAEQALITQLTGADQAADQYLVSLVISSCSAA